MKRRFENGNMEKKRVVVRVSETVSQKQDLVGLAKDDEDGGREVTTGIVEPRAWDGTEKKTTNSSNDEEKEKNVDGYRSGLTILFQ
jgi:hypothetical protein